MDYDKGYKTASSLADSIRQAALSGTKAKVGSGLASRMAKTEQKLSGFDDLIPQYMSFTRDLFAPIAEQREAMMASSVSGQSAASPAYGKSGPLASSISADVSDKGIRRILSALKSKESSGDYSAKNPNSSASGGYQFIDSTWQSLSNKYGIGTEYKTAKSAPTEVQDIVAARYVEDILAENNNDVTKVPVVWYTGNAAGSMSEEALAVNKGLTAERYQADWLRRYNAISGE